jgi:senataxin
LRPTLQKPARRRAPEHNKERFEAETLGGRLWLPDCQTAASKEELTDSIPMEFSSIDEYIAVFDPLVLEEARESLKAAWAENCSAGTMWRAEIVNVEPLNNGWASVQVRVPGRPQGEARAACGKEKSIVVLTLGKPPQRAAAEWAAALVKKVKEEEESPEEHAPAKKKARVYGEETPVPPAEGQIVAGIAIKSRESDLVFKIHAGCAAHDDVDGAPCTRALAALKVYRRGWWIAPAGMLTTSVSSCFEDYYLVIGPCTTLNGKAIAVGYLLVFSSLNQEREYDALHAVRTVDHNLMRHILKPKLLADIGRPYENEVGCIFSRSSLSNIDQSPWEAEVFLQYDIQL